MRTADSNKIVLVRMIIEQNTPEEICNLPLKNNFRMTSLDDVVGGALLEKY
jgi:hypothetical protein